MMIYKIILNNSLVLLFFCYSFSQIIFPIEGDTLNYREFPIEWKQEPSSVAYNIQLYRMSNPSELILDVVDTSLIYIVDESFIDWDEQYNIYLRSILDDGSYSSWIDSSLVNTYSIPEDYSNLSVETNTFIESHYEPGVTFLQKTIINKDGENVLFWKTPEIDHDGMNFTYVNVLNNGNLLGWITPSSESSFSGGVEITLDGEIIWTTGESAHHDIFPMPNGNYLGLVKEVFYAPPPEGPWIEDFEEYGITTIEWLGDKIIEWDSNGNIIWSWKTTDYISTEEFDPAWIQGSHLDDIMFGIQGFDWTHSNAVFYDEIENAVYLSVRHLSRIIKIDYDTGEIIWTMGKEFLPEVIDFGEELGFSYQHAIRVLDNRNLMLYDNGNQNNPQRSRCIELELNENQSSAQIVWEYVLPDSVFTASMGECDRLENGNTLITAGRANYVLEVDSDNNPVWEGNTDDPFYRSDRVASLYPLLFSIKIPNFSSSETFPMVYLPLGDSDFELTIFNEGHLDFDFSYSINDLFGWFNTEGTVSVPTNNNYVLDIPITINEELSNNIIDIEVCPVSVYDSPCKTMRLNGNTCLTNPGYYFSDMGVCLELIYGDINQDTIIDILDIIIMIDIIMGNIEPEQYMFLLSDMNQDNIIDIFDIINIINIILS